MRKKELIYIIIIAVLSITYVFAIDLYDMMPNMIWQLAKQLDIEDVVYEEIGISLSGIQYNKVLTENEVRAMNDEMVSALSHEEACSKLCLRPHANLATSHFVEDEQFIKMESTESEEEWKYTFILKEQQDVHKNAYYTLKIEGNHDLEKLDTLRNRGKELLKKWHVETKESIYFKGYKEGKLSQLEESKMAKEILKHLDAKSTNYYEDDLSASTCVYYGYTPHFKDYIEETNHQKTNMQIGFKYNDELNYTEIIIAFPFYNEPF